MPLALTFFVSIAMASVSVLLNKLSLSIYLCLINFNTFLFIYFRLCQVSTADQAFSSCSEQELAFAEVLWLLIAIASLIKAPGS